MDQSERTTAVIKAINKYQFKELEDFRLIPIVCEYFDSIKDKELSYPDLNFLKWISARVGIPHYYDLLEKHGRNIETSNINLSFFSALTYESTLFTSENVKLHKFQKNVLNQFKLHEINRYFLSASTSFGKTFLVYEVLNKMEYNNVLLIFPTIALLAENLETILNDKRFIHYKIHTLSDVKDLEKRNIFIFTPERFLSFIENTLLEIKFDFSFIDEIYKIDNDYIVEEEIQENERDVAYRLALHYVLKYYSDILLAGPYIDFPSSENNSSFFTFLEANNISLLDYNDYEVVNKEFQLFNNRNDTYRGKEINITVKNVSKRKMCVDIIKGLINTSDNIIVYCSRIQGTDAKNSYAQELIESQILSDHDYSKYESFIIHLETTFHPDWRLIQALKYGIGIHHGLIPKYVQKEIISLFNKQLLRVLFCTTTITEGVNTSAKYLIVTDAMKGDKTLKKFDAKNIAGRAGRFSYHYKGIVFVLQNEFMDRINAAPDPIKHKNYDEDSKKDEIDLFYTSDKFLNLDDQRKKTLILKEQIKRHIPEYIFDYYKVINREDKMKLYDDILLLTLTEHNAITTLIRQSNMGRMDYEGMQIVMNLLYPIIKNTSLITLIKYKDDNGYSSITRLLYAYLRNGMHGMIHYNIEKRGKDADEAIRSTTRLVYQVFKYQIVKYLGAFNVMYKYYLLEKSNIENTKNNFNRFSGIEGLLLKLEHNAFTPDGRIVSDYGVPSRIVDFFEETSEKKRLTLKSKLDAYEYSVLSKVENLIKPKEI